jgi:peptide/nickel transport system substrate-binding protein
MTIDRQKNPIVRLSHLYGLYFAGRTLGEDMPRSLMRATATRIAAAAGLAALALVGCANAGTPSGSAGGSAAGRVTTLTVNNNEGEPLTDNFNPLVPTSTLDVYGSWSMIYEPLVQYDPQRPGVTYPWLATKWSWSNNDQTLTFTLRNGVTWSDGKPFTSADVVYTFDLLKRDSAVNTTGIQFATVAANGKYQVTMTFAQPAYTDFYYIAETTPILPQHVWSTIGNPASYTDTNPIGTGPYVLKHFTPEDFLLTKNPHYWQPGLPKITNLDYVAGTATALQNMVNNQTLDWSSGGTPGAQKWQQASPFNHYWFPGAGVVSLEPNLARWPFTDVAVRKAISLAINRTVVGVRGEFGYETPVISATGLLPSQQSYVAAQYSGAKLAYDPAQAKSILTKAGYTMGSGGIFQKGGKPVAITIEDPSGFVDYITDCQLIDSELKQAGIAVTCDGVSTNAWGSDLASGNFDSTLRWSDFGNGDPYYLYNGWLNSTLYGPKGGTASDNFERWNSAATQQALSTYVSTSSTASRSAALATLEGVMVNQVPVIPLFDAADWGTYLTKRAQGWASPQNPYADDSPGGSYSEVVALHLTPVG